MFRQTVFSKLIVRLLSAIAETFQRLLHEWPHLKFCAQRRKGRGCRGFERRCRAGAERWDDGYYGCLAL